MNFARVLTAASACVALGAAGAACSGSFGSGSGLPTTLSSPVGGPGTPSPTPNSTSTILTYGESVEFQALPEIGGYSASIAFPKASASTKATQAVKGTPAPAPTPVSIAVGATLSVVKPDDGPDLNFESGKGRHKRTREHPARALAYITLLPTHDMVLESYPRIALDIPRETASQYRDGEFGLALWNAGEKDAKYRLAVAELDTDATPPPLVPTSVPTATARAKASASNPPASPASSSPSRFSLAPMPPAGPSGMPDAGGSAMPSASPTLPPARLVFAPTAATLKLIANRPAVFALYALPHPSAASAAPSPAASKAPAK